MAAGIRALSLGSRLDSNKGTKTLTKRTMKAAVVREFDKPLTIEDVPIPQPGACEGPGVRGVWDRVACGLRRLAGQVKHNRRVHVFLLLERKLLLR